MLIFLVRRFMGFLLSLLLISVLIFVLTDMLPGDPAAIILGEGVTPDALKILRLKMGLDLPVSSRYFSWISGILTGHSSVSYFYGVLTSSLIMERISITLPLTIFATVFAVSIALPLGVIAGARLDSKIDIFATSYSHIGIAIPNFWIGIILLYLLALQTKIFPSGGFPVWENGFWQALFALILPAITLAIPQSAVLTRMTRDCVSEMINKDFVRMARTKGISPRRALWRHAFPNALTPVLNMLGLQFSYMVSGTVLVENVFNFPGISRLAWQALAQRDFFVSRDVLLFFAVFVIFTNLFVDILNATLNPSLGR